MSHRLLRFAREFIRDIRNEKYDRTDGGILIKKGALLTGWYTEGIKGDPDSFRRHQNLIVDEGILKILGLAFYSDSKITAWYIAPFSGSTTPAANLTAANFASTQSEITSNTEGFSESTRQQWVTAAPASGKVTNTASKANFTIVTASAVNIKGAAILSSSTRGGTSGVLASCVKYGTTRVVNDADVWQCGYEVTLTDS